METSKKVVTFIKFVVIFFVCSILFWYIFMIFFPLPLIIGGLLGKSIPLLLSAYLAYEFSYSKVESIIANGTLSNKSITPSRLLGLILIAIMVFGVVLIIIIANSPNARSAFPIRIFMK